MANLSDIIEETIKKMIEQNNGTVEITRSRLAEMVNCVPSQITYVLSTPVQERPGLPGGEPARRGAAGSACGVWPCSPVRIT